MGAHLETIGHWEQAVVGPSSAPDFIVLEWRPLIGAQAPAMEQRMDAIREDRKKASKRALVLATCCGTPPVLAALLHGVQSIDTNDDKEPVIRGSLDLTPIQVEKATAAFHQALMPHQVWSGPLPVCLAEHHQGKVRRLRLVLATLTHLTRAEISSLQDGPYLPGGTTEHGLVYGYAVDAMPMPEWLVITDGQEPGHWRVLGRPTLATLESTAFLAHGFGAVNGQDFRTRRDPLGRFTLFLIRQLVSGSRVSLTQGRAGPAGVETAGREHGSCNHAVGE